MRAYRRFVLLIAFVCLALHAFASPHATAQGGRVYLNEMLVLTLRYGSSDSIVNRARAIASRLDNIDATAAISYAPDGSAFKIFSGDGVVLVVGGKEADAQNQAPETLAKAWAENIAKALSLPPIKIETGSVKLPVNGKSQISVLGAEYAEAKLTLSNPETVRIWRDTGVLQIRGLALGKCTIHIQGATDGEDVEVTILPYAANFPQSISVEVTGDPTSAQTLTGVVEGALRTQMRAEDDAEISYDLPKVSSLSMEGASDVSVRVKASAPNAFPSEGVVTVQCHNVPIAYASEAELWYCNDPENLRGTGMLFANLLERGQPVRLLYHHINTTGMPLFVQVHAINDSGTAARILLIPGDSKPDPNPVLAGFQAGSEFLQSWIHYSGEIVTVPPHSDLPIALHRLGSNQTASGLCYIRLLGGGDGNVLVRVDARTASQIEAQGMTAFDSAAAWRIQGTHRLTPSDVSRVHLSNEVFPKPFREQDVDYHVGGRYGFMRIGQRAIHGSDGHPLEGNFGVVYTIKATMDNPTPEARDIEVVFESSAGYTGALFLFDGKLVKTPLLQPKEEIQIARLHLEPNDTKQMTFLTMPLSGGSYPATITIRPVEK